MRHHKKGKKFGRETTQRKAFMRSLALNLIENGRIKTTLPRARQLRPFVEKLVTHARKNALASRRLLISRLASKKGVAALIKRAAENYKTRAGGYTRIIKVNKRKGDASKMAMIEFV